MPQEPKSFYIQSPHSTNAFQSVRMSIKSDMRVPKPPKPPEKPLMPYMRYSRKVWEQVKNSNPHLKLWEVGKIIGQMWRELPDDEKTLYVEEYDAEKTQYTELLRQYHSSPAYQAWLVAKERAEKNMEEQDQERKQAGLRARERAGDIPQTDLRESYILEDNEEDSEDQYTAKHVAAARFQRNHRLMQEILSDARLPDPGQLITQSRLNTLRLQVEQLRNHKRNLCQEIDGCEARHLTKVQRIRDESERFRTEYEKVTVTRPVITESQFADMIVKAKQDMQREEEEHRNRYLAELELRRRRQQQRQQREAELIEAERRRQLSQQQQNQQQQQQLQQATVRVQHTAPPHAEQNLQYNERPLERLITQEKKDDVNLQQSPKISVNPINPVIHAPLKGTPTDTVNQPSNLPYPVGVPSNFNQAVSSPCHRFPQSGHTQHHYPPPPHYLPSSVNPVNPPIPHQRGQLGNIQQNPSLTVNKPMVSVARPKKIPSSASSTSSASSASSTSSKKKKSDVPDLSKERPLSDAAAGGSDVNERRVSGPNEVSDQQKPNEFPTNAVPPNEIQQGLPVQSRQFSSQYQPPNVPPNTMVSGQNNVGVSQTGYAYEHGMPNPVNPSMHPGNYYPPGNAPHNGPHPSGYPSHPRGPFNQPGPYNPMQYPPIPQQPPNEHPPPPPVYVQHMPQQPHVGQAGPPMVGPGQHPANHMPPHSHQSAPGNWHPGGPSPYPPHYGPSRYPAPSGPVGYPGQSRHFGPASGGYSVSHHIISQHNTQQVPPIPVSMPEGGTGSQPIPAPPPYQQQQQPAPQQQPNSPMGYWTSHQVPPDYGQSQQSHHYLSGQQSEPVNQSAPAQMDSMHPGSTIAGPTQTDVGMPPMPPQHSQSGGSMYYSGGPPPSYGHQGNINSAGFYSLPQHHHYPPPHPQNPHGQWSGYPQNIGPHHAPYQSTQNQQPQQQQQQSHCIPGSAYPGPQIQLKNEQMGGPNVSIEGSSGMAPTASNSRPPSASS